MDNETRISVSFKNSVTNANKLDNYAKQLKEIYSILSAIDKGKLAQMGDFNVSLTKMSNNTDKIEKTTSKFSKNLNTAFNLGKIAIVSRKVYNLAKGFGELTNKSASYIENLNLLEVAYANIDKKTGQFNEDIKTTSERIEKLINNMSQVYGLDESDLSRQFGIFKQLANAMELPNKEAERLSELMVKMRQDIASLYNLNLSRAGNALQSALAGQVRPIRSATGADITEKTLQKTVDNLGLDTTINKLSFVEKRLIMVISLTNQLKNSQGDYGRTIESVANQVKVFHDQWDRLSRAVGNVFYPLMKSVLPVVNGVLMALTEIANIIATLVGFKLDDFDYSGLAGVSDATLDLEESMNDAGDSVDKLKKKLSGLRSFDKLNVISTPKDTSSGVGGGTINPKILEAFNDAFSNYNDMLGKVRMKANDIRDNIMKWLGFTKKINPLTGEIQWEYQGISKTFNNIWDSIKNLSPELKLLVAGITTLIGVKTINGISSLVSKFQLLTGWTQKTANGMETLKGINKVNIDYWKENASTIQKLTTALIGAGGLLIGFQLISAGMDEVNEKGLTLNASMQILGGTMSNVLGGTMIGASIGGGWGALIGGIGGLLISLIEGFSNVKSEAEKFAETLVESLEPMKKYNDELQKQFDIIDENGKSQFLTVGVHQGLLEELKKITDENGRVQYGYEKRAQFIISELNKAYDTEIKMVDGVIEKYDEQITKIQELIDKKRLQIATELAEEKYKVAIQEQTNAYNNLKEAEIKHTEAQQELQKNEELLAKMTGKTNKLIIAEYGSYEEYRKHLANILPAYKKVYDAEREAQQTLDNSEKAYNDTQKAILVYSKVVEASYESNADEAEYWLNKLLSNYEQETGIYTKIANEAEKSYQDRVAIAKEAGIKITEAEETLFNQRYNELVLQLNKEKDAIYDNEEDYVGAWMQVASHSKEMFLDGIKDLPEDVQEKLRNKMKLMENIGEEISDNIQDGINKKNPWVDIAVKTKTTSIRDNIVTALQKMSNVAGSVMSMIGFPQSVINSLKNIKLYAGGGILPPAGNMFVMNEKEPELLGTIGGKSFVANQSQMMELLDKKIGNAQKNTGTQVINLYLDADHKIGTYTLEQLQNMAKTDGKPITIG